jgi:hypothetical protein
MAKSRFKYNNQMTTGDPIAKKLMRVIREENGFTLEHYDQEHLRKITRAAIDFFGKNLDKITEPHVDKIARAPYLEVNRAYGHLENFEALHQALIKYFEDL